MQFTKAKWLLLEIKHILLVKLKKTNYLTTSETASCLFEHQVTFLPTVTSTTTGELRPLQVYPDVTAKYIKN